MSDETTLLALDLLVVGVRAGLSVVDAVVAVAEIIPEAFGGVLADVVTAADGDVPRCLRDGAIRCGHPDDLPLLVLADALESGHAVVATLDGLAADLRRRRRRGIEASARRLPVTVLAPMVCCLLPATLLVTIVPAFVAGIDRIAA